MTTFFQRLLGASLDAKLPLYAPRPTQRNRECAFDPMLPPGGGKCVDRWPSFRSPHLDRVRSPRHGHGMTCGPALPRIAESHAKGADEAVFRLIRLMAEQAAREFLRAAPDVEATPDDPEQHEAA